MGKFWVEVSWNLMIYMTFENFQHSDWLKWEVIWCDNKGLGTTGGCHRDEIRHDMEMILGTTSGTIWGWHGDNIWDGIGTTGEWYWRQYDHDMGTTSGMTQGSHRNTGFFCWLLNGYVTADSSGPFKLKKYK